MSDPIEELRCLGHIIDDGAPTETDYARARALIMQALQDTGSGPSIEAVTNVCARFHGLGRVYDNALWLVEVEESGAEDERDQRTRVGQVIHAQQRLSR